jgi:low temperature requirement protein LtrA
VSDAQRGSDHRDEHQVTPLELFFDLVFVFAITQVTGLIAHDPTWEGVLHGMLVLAAIWWAWNAYAWLTSATDVDEGGVRLAMLGAMAAMFGVALAVPGSFGNDALLFGLAYGAVRVLHLVLSAIPARVDPGRRGAIIRFAPTALLAVLLLVAAAFVEGNTRIVLWVVALAIDYLGPVIFGVGQGWQVAPEHFAERYGLFVIIALGESFIAIGVGLGPDVELRSRVLAAATLGIMGISALWWLYFDVAAIFARRRLIRAQGVELHLLAMHSYSYLHLPLIAGIVLFAFGLETTIAHVGDRLDIVPAVGLCGGAALYLLGHIAFLYRTTGRIFRRRTIGAFVLVVLLPVAIAIPALTALALVSTVCALIVAYEALRYREDRLRVRHPQNHRDG